MRVGWIAVGLLLLAALVWWFVDRSTSAGPAPHADDAAGGDSRPGLMGSRRERTPKEAGPPPATTEADEEEAEHWIPEGEAKMVRGTVVLVDDDGVETAVTSGTLRFDVWRGNSGDMREASVTHGAWRARIRRGSKIHPTVLSVAGRHAWFPDAEEPRAVGADGTLALRAVLPPVTILHVVDAETGADLPIVHVLRTRSSARLHDHPGLRLHRLDPARAERSPFRLDPADVDLEQYRVLHHVWSPGYAWRRLEVDFRAGGTQTVRLPRGGDLDVALTGGPHRLGAALRLRSGGPGGPVVMAWYPEAAQSSYFVDGIAAGDYALQFEFDEARGKPKVLAATEVTIRADARVSLTLELPRYVPPRPVPYAGELRVPDGWDFDEPHCWLERLDAPVGGAAALAWLKLGAAASDGAGARIFPFTTEPLHAGAYLFECRGLGPLERVSIVAPGTRSARLELPPPVRVSVGIRGDQAWPNDRVAEIEWYAVGPKGVRSWTPAYVGRRAKAERFEFVAPAGVLRVGVRGLGYFASRLEERVDAPRARLTLEVRRTASVLLRPEVEGRRVPWDLDGLVTVRAASGSADQLLRLTHTDAGCRLEIDTPGRYRIEIEDVAGYERPRSLDAEFVQGKPTVVVVPLVKKR